MGAVAGRQVMRTLKHEAKELGHHPDALGTHERALRSGGLFSRHSRKMHREEEQEDQSEAESPISLDQHGVIETRGVDSCAPWRDAEGGRSGVRGRVRDGSGMVSKTPAVVLWNILAMLVSNSWCPRQPF